MNILEHLAHTSEPQISFEVTPPLRGKKRSVSSLLEIIDGLAQYQPPFIDVTSHAAERKEEANGIIRRRKRPGTLGICALIQHKYKIDAVPHVVCRGFTREETEDFLIDIQYLGIDNVLAIQGDDNGYKKPLLEGRSRNEHASALVTQIAAMNNGKYLNDIQAESTKFCIGVAGYPEKHYASPDIETDISYLKQKVDCGASYIVTQMFFDNEKYFDFVTQCKNIGIHSPIIPGLKIITGKEQLFSIPNNFHIEIPTPLAEEIQKAKPEHCADIGIEWAIKQAEGLLNAKVPIVHFYVMQNAEEVGKVIVRLQK